MLQLRQMNITSSAGYQSTGATQLLLIAHPAPALAIASVHEVSAAQNHKERKLAEAKRRSEVQNMTLEDYTNTPEGDARRLRQAERAQMHEEELHMMRIVEAEHAAARALALQRAREDDARVREMYLAKLRAAREDAERAAQEKERVRQLALEAKMRALKDAADAQAREAYAARQRQLEADALQAREQRIAAAETALLAVEDELAVAMAHADAVEHERLAQIAAEETQWKRFEEIEAQKQREATMLRRAAQATQYEQDKQRRMEIHRLQKERARLAEQRALTHTAVVLSEPSAVEAIAVATEAKAGAVDDEGTDISSAAQANQETATDVVQAGESNQSEHGAVKAVAPATDKAVDEELPQASQAGDNVDTKQLEGPMGQDPTLCSSSSPTVAAVALLDESAVAKLDHSAPADRLDPEPACGAVDTLEDAPLSAGVADTRSGASSDALLQVNESIAEARDNLQVDKSALNTPDEREAKTRMEPSKASGDAHQEQLPDDCASRPLPATAASAAIDAVASTSPASPRDAPELLQTLEDGVSTALARDDDEEKHAEEGRTESLLQAPGRRVVSIQEAQTQELNPFAQVLHVKAGSPAMAATLQAGDLLIDFGGITVSTPNCLLLIAEHVMSALDQDVALVVLRPQHCASTDPVALNDEGEVDGDDGEQFVLTSLSLRPRKWAGKGLLGCQLHPFKWPVRQPLVQDEASASTNLLVFYNVAPTSLADAAGIHNGDLLMRCGALATADDLESVLAYVEIAKAARTPLELALARWVPDAQAYESLTVVLAVSEATPLGCSLTTFAAYYNSSSSSNESATPALASACMDCYYTTLATAVHAAALNGHVSCLDALLEAARQDASDSGGTGILDWRDDDGRSPLFYACYTQQVETVRFILTRMAQDEPYDPQTGGDRYGDSPLHAAASSGSVAILELLLEQRVVHVDVVNATQLTCAHVAASVDILELLGERYGADLLAADADGRMPLSHACLRHDLASIQYLCWKHPDFVDYADARGNTPLHLAAWLGYSDVVEELVQHVPSIALYVPNEDGANPLEIAQASGADETAAILAACMAAASSHGEDSAFGA